MLGPANERALPRPALRLREEAAKSPDVASPDSRTPDVQ
jgi:hypothetical protein